MIHPMTVWYRVTIGLIVLPCLYILISLIIRWYHPSVLAKYTSVHETVHATDDDTHAPVIAPDLEHTYDEMTPRSIVSDGAKQVIINQSFWEDVKHAIHKNMYEDAQRLLVAGLTDDPYNIQIMKELAGIYCTTKQSKKAFPLYKKVLDIDHADHKVMSQLARLYIDEHDNESAEMIIRQALHIAPENPKYMVILVEILYESARYEEAIDIMEAVIKIRPSTVQYRDILGSLYEQTQLIQEALYCYQHILTLDNANVYARKKLRTLHQMGR